MRISHTIQKLITKLPDDTLTKIDKQLVSWTKEATTFLATSLIAYLVKKKLATTVRNKLTSAGRRVGD